MSLIDNGRIIRCDGSGCHRTVEAPVRLHQLPTKGGMENSSSVRGWLFVSRHGEWTHLCPQCIQRYEGASSDNSALVTTRTVRQSA